MKDIENVRNIGISAHIDSGKTTLTERILFYSGRIHRIKEVKGGDGGATMDSMDLERERGITIQSAATRVQWGETLVNIIDTPGHVDFTVEVERSLRVLDGAIMVLCAVGGVQSQSFTVDRQMKRYHVPRICFINKMDRTGADPDSVIQQVKDRLGLVAVPLQIEIGKESAFEGVVDLVTMQATYFDGEKGEDIRREPIPASCQKKADEARRHLLDTLSMFDDELMGLWMDGNDPSVEKIKQVIRQATISHAICPVMMGSAYKNKAVQELLDGVTWYLPSPLDRQIYAQNLDQKDEQGKGAPLVLSTSDTDPVVCMAFKTVIEQFGQLTYTRIYQGQIKKGDSFWNARTGKKVRFGRLVRMHADEREEIDSAGAGDIIAIVGVDCASGETFHGDGVNVALENIFVPDAVLRLSIEPSTREFVDKMGKALERFRREDPTFRVMSDHETGETIIAGMGQLHLEIYVERMKREYGVEVDVGEPKVAYRECPTKAVEFNYKHKKQTGGSGQYAHVVGRLQPLPADSDVTHKFTNSVTQGRIPKEYIPAIEEGFELSLVKGPLCECEITGLEMVIVDGSYHDVDSSEMAFKVCTLGLMREYITQVGMALLEPIMKLEIEAPENYQGSITGHLSSKRGTIVQTDVRAQSCIIEAEAPLAEMFDYANELRSMTQGKGQFSMEFLKYQQVPKFVQEVVVVKRRKDKADREARKK